MNINKENRDTQLKAHGQCSQNEPAPLDSSKQLLILGPNVFTIPIKAMGCRQCLFLNVVQLKGKHCPKPHCRNGVVDMFRHRLFSKIKDAQYNRFLGLKILVFSDYFLVGLLNKNKFRCPYYVLWLDNPIKIRSRSQSRRRQKAMTVLIIMIYHIKSKIVFDKKKSDAILQIVRRM